MSLGRYDAESQAIWLMTLRCTLISEIIFAEITLKSNVFNTNKSDSCLY